MEWEKPSAWWLDSGHLGLVLQLQDSVLMVVKSGHMTDCSAQGIEADGYWQGEGAVAGEFLAGSNKLQAQSSHGAGRPDGAHECQCPRPLHLTSLLSLDGAV